MQTILDLLKVFGAVGFGTLILALVYKYIEARDAVYERNKLLRKEKADEVIHQNNSRTVGDLIKRENERFESGEYKDPNGQGD